MPWPPGVALKEGGDMNTLLSFSPMVLIFVVFYFLLIRPQQKKAKDQRVMLENLKKGDSVITQGGIYGKIASISGPGSHFRDRRQGAGACRQIPYSRNRPHGFRFRY